MQNILTQDKQPLFEDILWSRPERAAQAGKLIIIGGNRESLSAPMEAYSAANDHGAGSVTVVLPDVHKKQLKGIPGILFCASNNSGGLAKDALIPIINAGSNADFLLLPGSLANNSETTQLIESLVDRGVAPMVLAGDALDQCVKISGLIDRPHLTLVSSPSQFQKIATNLKSTTAYTPNMPLPAFENLLMQLVIKSNLIVLHAGYLWVKADHKISRTKRADLSDDNTWAVDIATRSAVFLMQHPDEPFEALTTAVFNQKEIYV